MPRCNFIIDKLTNSLEERVTGKIFATTVQVATEKDLKNLFKKDGWNFKWRQQLKFPNREVFKLLINGDNEIQGLLSLEIIWIERYIELHLIENAPHNFGRNKRFAGVPGNLVAFACKTSVDIGFDGVVGFTAKTKLISHYKNKLGAQNIFGNSRMAIYPNEAKKIVDLYFKNYRDED